MSKTETCITCGAEISWPAHKEFICKDRVYAIHWARHMLEQPNVVYLDLETTGLEAPDIVQIGLVDNEGKVLIDTLVKPGKKIEAGAYRVHHISNSMVEDAPTFLEIYDKLVEHTTGKIVIIYNMAFDRPVIQRLVKKHGLQPIMAKGVECAMLKNARFVGEWSSYHQSYTWPKLIGGDHSAAGDCQAIRDLLVKMANSLPEGK